MDEVQIVDVLSSLTTLWTDRMKALKQIRSIVTSLPAHHAATSVESFHSVLLLQVLGRLPHGKLRTLSATRASFYASQGSMFNHYYNC